MRGAIMKPTDKERSERLAQFRADMAQDDEPDDRAPEGAVVAYVIIFAAILCIALAVTFTGWL